jgi:hypothetical protein
VSRRLRLCEPQRRREPGEVGVCSFVLARRDVVCGLAALSRARALIWLCKFGVPAGLDECGGRVVFVASSCARSAEQTRALTEADAMSQSRL